MRERNFRKLPSKKVIAVGIVCMLALGVALYFYLGHGSNNKKKKSKGVPAVRVHTVVRGDMMRTIDLSGQTVADAVIELSPKYSGRIIKINAKLGSRVHKGDALLVQDARDVELSILEGEAATGAANADATIADAEFNANYYKAKNTYEIELAKYYRNVHLFEIGAISQDRLNEVKEEMMASKAVYEALDNQRGNGIPASVEAKRFTAEKNARATDELRQHMHDMVLYAPRDGVIGYRNAEVGELVSAGTKVFTLVDTSHTYVDVNISESDAAVLTEGMGLTVLIDAMGKKYDGEIVYVSPTMTEDTKTYVARIALDDVDGKIKDGLFAHSKVEMLQREDTIYVPKEAIITKNGETSVFVIDEDGKVTQRDVRIGLINDTEEEVIDGLDEGDVVVLNNQDRLRDGMKVKILEESE